MPATLKSRLPAIILELQAIDPALRTGAELVAEEAKARVDVETGELRSKIHVEPADEGGYYVVAGDNSAFYGHLLEFGTTHSPPHPFLVPALEAKSDAVVDQVEVLLRAL